MASGTIALTSDKAWRGSITWSSTMDIATNSSELSVTATMWKTDGWLTSSNNPTSGTITINGETYSLRGYKEFKEEVTIFEDTITIYHNNDGSKSVSISLTCNGQPSTSLSGHTLDGSADITLDNIPRASTFTAGNGVIESSCHIVINSKSTAMSHRVKVTFGSLVGYVTNNGGFSTSVSTIQGYNTDIYFTIPTDFYYQIPNKKSGTATLQLYTMAGSTTVDSSQSTNITISTDGSKCGPLFGFNAKADKSVSDLTGVTNPATVIRGYTGATITFTSLEARYGASLTGDPTSSTDTFVKNSDGTYYIETVAGKSITFTVKDSRGYSNTQTVTWKNYVEYIRLTNNSTAGRSNPTDGSAYIEFRGAYFNSSFGQQNNSLEISYHIVNPDGTKTSEVSVSDITMQNSEFYSRVDMTGFVYTQVYTAVVTVKDKLLTVTKEITIKQGIPVFDWGRDDFQFHVPVYINGEEVATKNGSGDVDSLVYKSGDSVEFTNFSAAFYGFVRTYSSQQWIDLCIPLSKPVTAKGFDVYSANLYVFVNGKMLSFNSTTNLSEKKITPTGILIRYFYSGNSFNSSLTGYHAATFTPYETLTITFN